MFYSPTVFVLGAGASAEVGLPVGNALLENICDLVDLKYEVGSLASGDYQISDALKLILDEGRSVEEYSKHQRAAWQIVSSAKQGISIDNIVEALEDERATLVAKLGITRAIHKAEADSEFFKPDQSNDGNLRLENFADTWYSQLTKLLCENRKKSQIADIFHNISFVSFNYDRCIEHYLPRSVANYYGVEIAEVNKIFKEVKIHRPYGIAGVTGLGNRGVRHFGGENTDYLAKSADMIRTFTEGVEKPETLTEMRTDLELASRVVFLGSAFHRQNLKLLEVQAEQGVKIFGTASGISDSDLRVVREDLGRTFGLKKAQRDTDIELANMYCNKFFQEYQRSLSA